MIVLQGMLQELAIDNQPPTVVNTWYRYSTSGAGTPTLPTELIRKFNSYIQYLHHKYFVEFTKSYQT